MSEWVSEWVSEWMDEWVSGWVSEGVNEWMNEWVNEWMNEWMNECTEYDDDDDLGKAKASHRTGLPSGWTVREYSCAWCSVETGFRRTETTLVQADTCRILCFSDRDTWLPAPCLPILPLPMASCLSSGWTWSVQHIYSTLNSDAVQYIAPFPPHSRDFSSPTPIPVAKQYNLVIANGRRCLEAGKVNVGLASHGHMRHRH